MTEPSRVLVDTNVIFDVLHADPAWLSWSCGQLERFSERLLINPLIFSEICYQAVDQEEAESVVATLGLAYAEVPRRALFLAAKAYQRYRGAGE